VRWLTAWLTAGPWNAVLGLSLTLLLPFAPLLSGGVMVLLVLSQGAQRATLAALGAAALVAVLFAVFGRSVPAILANAAIAWVPGALLGVIVRQARSLTLGLQLSVLLAVVATLGFFVALDDPTAFWTAQLAGFAEAFEGTEFAERAAVLSEQSELIAPQMTMLFVMAIWSIVALVLVIGNALYQQLPETEARFGRFCDLNFGRVLALMMAVASLAAVVINASWLHNLAFVLFAVFWLQGMAVLHWLHTDGPLPLLAVIGVYVLLPFLNALLVMVLAVLGYTDAWFEYRPRIAAARKSK